MEQPQKLTATIDLTDEQVLQVLKEYFTKKGLTVTKVELFVQNETSSYFGVDDHYVPKFKKASITTEMDLNKTV